MNGDPASAPYDVVVLGEANPDLVLRGDVTPAFGQSEQLLEAADLVLGGSGAITAHALARLGLRVALLAEVGDDLFGRFVIDELSAAGVDTGLVSVGAAPTGLSVVLSRGTDRATLTLVGAIDAAPPGWRVPADVPPMRHLHVASYFLQPRRAAELPRLLALVRASGATTSLDTNLDPRGQYAGLAEVLPHVDTLLPNATEALALARAVGVETDDIGEAGDALAELAGEVVVKDGARGAVLFRSGHAPRREAGRPVTPVDTTGAGDTFDAAFLMTRLAGLDDAVCLRRACAAGALSTQRPGGTGGQPTKVELLAALAASLGSDS